MSRFRFTLLLLTGAFIPLPTAGAQTAVAAADDAAKLLTRFYDITPLVVPRQQFPFNSDSGNRIGIVYPGGNLGGGTGGGGPSAGGGYFSLPVEPMPFGGGGSGGQVGYSGNDWQASSMEPSLKEQFESTGISITGLFESNVAPDSWVTNGGEGSITELGNTLLVRQTEKVQSEFEEFLKQLTSAVIGNGTYHLDVWWLPMADANRAQMKELLESTPADGAVSEQLTTLSESTGGYHGMLLCRERVNTHMASGHQVPVVVGSVPNVAPKAVGYQPIVKTLHLGLLLEARLSPVPDYLATVGDGTNAETLELSFRSAITNRSDKGQEWPADGQIDRYSMGKHVAQGACQIQLGKPTLIASLTELSSATENAAGQTPELMMVVRVTRSEN